MIEPHVKGVNERGEPYDFIADSATQAAKDADIMYLAGGPGKDDRTRRQGLDAHRAGWRSQ